jgi:CBS domain-containing protein
MKARDVMKTHPSVVTPDDPISKAARILRDRNIGMLPVIDNLRDRSLQGVLTDRDIVVRCTAEGHDSKCRVRDHMTTGSLKCVELDTDVSDVAAKMEGFQVRRLPVLGENGELVGVVAHQDLLARLRHGAPRLAEDVDHHGPRPAALAH